MLLFWQIKGYALKEKMKDLWNGALQSDSQKSFDDVVDETTKSDDWLRQNIRESITKNAEIWAELART